MEDCYFFVEIDPEVPEDQRKMSVLCVSCHDQYYPELGWYYEGSDQGYGPFTYQCCKCNKIIYEEKDETE